MVKSISKGLLYAVVMTLVLVLLFALAIKWANLSDDVIKPGMQIIKVVCIFFGVAVALKQAKRHGWLYGGIVGILYMVLTFIIFSLLDGNFVIGINAVYDLLFAMVVGIISACLLRLRNKDVTMA